MEQKREKYNIAVLVVEDDPFILEQLMQLLSRRVAKTYGAENGAEGLKIFQSEEIDLILSDIDMPIMNGLELLKSVRAQNEQIPFILSTGLKSLDVLTTAIEYGITSFLPKPLQKATLLKKIDAIALEKQLQSDLKKSQDILQQYKNAVDTSSIVSKTNARGVITYVNDMFCELSGYSREELVGQPHNLVRHPDMPSDFFEDLWSTIQSKSIWHGIVNNLAKNGTTYTVKSSIIPILDNDGDIIEYLSIREDVTQEVKNDQTLELERKKLYHILNNMENVVGMSNQGRELLFINERFFHSFPYADLKDFLKDNNCICDLFLPKEGYLQSVMDGEVWVEHILKHPEKIHRAQLIDKTNATRVFSVKVNKIVEGDTFFYLFTLNDITELDKLREEAENAAKAKGQFLANMSHEIRTPMNGILGFTKLLEQTSLNDKQKRYLDIIDGSTNTLLGIINDILDFSKLQSGKMKLDETQVNPFVEFKKTAMLFMAKIEEKGIKFKIEIDPAISECVSLDLLRMQQIVSNLLSNAIKFTPKNGTILFYLKLLEKQVGEIRMRIGVEDNGIGISKEAQSRIFQAFSQADGSTTREFGGTGLGLTISAHFVSLMGGSLQVDSQEGIGSNFFFDIVAKTFEAEHSLSKLFGNLSLSVVNDSAQASAIQEKVARYLDALGISYKNLDTNIVEEKIESDAVYILFSQSNEALLKRLAEENVDVIIASNNMENKIEAQNATIVSDFENNLSVLYNALLEIGMRRSADDVTKTHVYQEGKRAYSGEVLVAEDNEVNQMLINEMLLQYGLEPTIVVNGRRALVKAEQEAYDLILMDINMPVMGGVEALRLIKEKGILTPVVALTANAMEGDKENFLKEGFDNYLTKPIVIEELENVLDTYLKHKKKETLAVDLGERKEAAFAWYVDMDLIRSELRFPDALIFKLLKSFIDTYSDQVEKLSLGIKNKDYDEIKYAAHALKGSSANIRLTRVAELAKELEEASLKQINIDYEAVFAQLLEVLARVKVEVEEIIHE